MKVITRAEVIDDQDPEHQERIRVRLLDGAGQKHELWAAPCLLYNPCGQGGFSPPPPGSKVLVEFEREKPYESVWLGLCLG